MMGDITLFQTAMNGDNARALATLWLLMAFIATNRTPHFSLPRAHPTARRPRYSRYRHFTAHM